jgi:CHAT domain-containing protein/Tfp pilus assembly protein PilF
MFTDSKMKLYFLLIVYLFFAVNLFAQNGNANIDALILDAKYTEAIESIDQALNKAPDTENKLLLENKKAETLIKLGKLEAADAIVSTMESEIENSSALSFANPIIHTTKGLLYLNHGRNDLALETFEKAINEFDQQNKANSLDAAQALSYLGLTFINTGKYAQAEEQLQEALTLRQNQLSESHELIAASYNDLGLVFSFQSDNDKALDYYEKALTIYKKLHGNEHPKIAIANTNIGIAYRNLELYGDAINDFETALKIWEKIYPNAHPAKGFVLSNLALTYLKMGDQKAALGYYDRALKTFEESYGKKHPDIAGVMNAIGNIKVSSNHYSEALSYYQQALKANVSSFNGDDLNTNPKLESYYNGNILLYSLLFKAEALEAKYYGKSLKFSELNSALRSLHTCDTLIDNLRKQITNEGDKIALGIIASEVYAGGVRIAYNAGLNAVSKKKYFEDAFYFAEKSKSAVLLEAIADAEAKSFAGIPATLFEEEKNLKSAIALCTQKLAQKPGAEEEKYLREAAFNLNKSYEAFTRKLEKEFPEYYNLKFNTASPSTKQLQSLLNDKTALVSYFTDDKSKRLYIFVIEKNKFKIYDHELPPEFNKYVTGLRNSLFFNDQKIFTSTSGKLYQLLIPKISSKVNDLIILPTGRLSIIPFEALLTTNVKVGTTYQQLPYLLKKYNISYEFSAGLMLQKSKHKQAQGTPSIFLCAPVNFPEKDNLNELPGTASEVKEISDLFANKSINKALYLNQDANEKLIKSGALKNFELVHFATHGIVDEKSPELSRIYLQDAESEDGNLFAGEIYNLELNANLVTLSACQTGLGKISKGEGVIGLSRALTYAGAKNVIVSFWSVADQSTASLMKTFYEDLLKSNASYNFSKSLREAKLQLMKNSQYAAPYYWAPFILIGN